MGNSAQNGKDRIVTDDLLIRFLLGELEDSERAQVAEQSLLDDDLFDRLLEAENDLVDRYVNGELTARERELFENALLHREPMRLKLVIARTLRTALSGPAQMASAPVSGVQADVRISARRNALPYRLAAAAAVVVLIWGAVWFIRHGSEPPGRTENPQAGDYQGREAGHPSPDHTAGSSKDAQNDSVIGAPTPQNGDRSGAASGNRPGPAEAVGTFVLLPGSTRSGEGAQVLSIGSAIRSVRLELRLDETDEYPVYDAILRTVGGSIVVKRTALAPRRLRTSKAVTVELGAERLAPGEYEVELSGRRPAGPATLVNYYYFVVAQNG